MRRYLTLSLVLALAPLGGCTVVSAAGAVVSATGTVVGAAASATETAIDAVAGGDEDCRDGRNSDGESC